MTAKEYLSQIPKLNRLVHRLYDTVQMMRRDLVCFSSSLNPDKIPTASGGGDAVSASVARVVDLEQEMRKQIEKLAQQKAEAYQKIQALPRFRLAKRASCKIFSGTELEGNCCHCPSR